MPTDAAEVTLEPLDVNDVGRLLAFETENKEFFARAVGERPSGYFEAASLREIVQRLIDPIEGADDRMYLVIQGQTLVGRANLTGIGERGEGIADVGYRVGERFTGMGVATKAVELLVGCAEREHRLTALVALVTTDNAASQQVLRRNGFVHNGLTETVAADTGPMRTLRFDRRLGGPGT